MFLCNIELYYGDLEKLKDLSEADKDELCRRFPAYAKARKDDGSFDYVYSDQLADDSDVQWLTERGFSFTVKRLRGLTGPSHWDGAAALQNAAPVQVHVPNVGLLSYDEVDLLENACTDTVQAQLDEGWRIIAVCPPNSARRPDYILGRRKPT